MTTEFASEKLELTSEGVTVDGIQLPGNILGRDVVITEHRTTSDALEFHAVTITIYANEVETTELAEGARIIRQRY